MEDSKEVPLLSDYNRLSADVSKSPPKNRGILEMIQFNPPEKSQQHDAWQRTEMLKSQGPETLRQSVQYAKCIILPDDLFYQLWSPLIICLLIYTAIVTPYTIIFNSHAKLWIDVIDYIMDLVFLIDVFVNCFLAYFDDMQVLITDKRKIFLRYLRTWMIIDIIAWTPVSLIFSAVNYTNLIRLARLPRLARLLKVLGLVSSKATIARKTCQTKLLQWLHISAGMERLIWFILIFFVIVNWLSCAFGLLGFWETDTVLSWMQVYHFDEKEGLDLYAIWFYWTITTLTTVGYGDISPQNNAERIYANFVMIAGIFIYSYIIGAVAGLISGLDAEKDELQKKCQILNHFADKFNISTQFYRKIMNAIYYEAQSRNTVFDEMLQILPPSIQNECLSMIYEKLLSGNKFFRNKPVEFIGLIAPKLKFYRFDQDECIYKINDIATEMYFVVQGKVDLAIELTDGYVVPYITCTSGKHFGEIDMIMDPKQLHRDYAQVVHHCELLAISKDDLLEVLAKFHDNSQIFFEKTKARQNRYNDKKKEARQQSPEQQKPKLMAAAWTRTLFKSGMNEKADEPAKISELESQIQELREKQIETQKMVGAIYSYILKQDPSIDVNSEGSSLQDPKNQGDKDQDQDKANL